MIFDSIRYNMSDFQEKHSIGKISIIIKIDVKFHQDVWLSFSRCSQIESFYTVSHSGEEIDEKVSGQHF